jgi:hypothetical protein
MAEDVAAKLNNGPMVEFLKLARLSWLQRRMNLAALQKDNLLRVPYDKGGDGKADTECY